MRIVSQRGWAPRPRLSSPGEQERNAVMAIRVGSICCSSFQSPTHLSHSKIFGNPFEPFQIKWEVYFSKELCPLVYIASLCFCVHMCMYSCSWLYNKYSSRYQQWQSLDSFHSSFISKSSSLCINPLVTVTRVPNTIGINVPFMFHIFSISLQGRVYLSFFSLSFNFTLWSVGTVKSIILKFSFFFFFFFFFFFLLIIMRSGCLDKIRGSVCISKSQWWLRVSFSRTDIGLCIYHLLLWSDLDFLHNSLWITLPTQSCQVLYSFCATLVSSIF